MGQLPNGTLPQAVAAGQDGEQGLQPRAESPGRHPRRQRGTGAGTAGRASEPVQAVFRHLDFDGRYLGDLVPAGVRVFAVKGLPALSAGRGHQADGLLDLLGRHQGALLPCVAGLPALLATRRGQGGAAFDVGRVARRRAGGVGGIPVEAFGELTDLLLEGLQPLLIMLDEGQDGRLGHRRYLIPQLNRDRRNRRHTLILGHLETCTSSGCERLHGGYSVAIPAFPGCISQGDSLEEARPSIREATELWLECMNERAPFDADGGEEFCEEWACESRFG